MMVERRGRSNGKGQGRRRQKGVRASRQASKRDVVSETSERARIWIVCFSLTQRRKAQHSGEV
jgi:hypothetical protein